MKSTSTFDQTFYVVLRMTILWKTCLLILTNSNMTDESKRQNNVTIMSTIRMIEISYSNKIRNNSINMLIIVNRNFSDSRFRINLVIKIMFIKIISFHNNLVRNISNLIINRTTSNKSFRFIKSTITTTTIKTINIQTFAFYHRHRIDCRLSSIQQTTTRQIWISNHNDSFLNQRATINFEMTSTTIFRVFNQFIKQTFLKKSTRTLLYEHWTNLTTFIDLLTIRKNNQITFTTITFRIWKRLKTSIFFHRSLKSSTFTFATFARLHFRFVINFSSIFAIFVDLITSSMLITSRQLRSSKQVILRCQRQRSQKHVVWFNQSSFRIKSISITHFENINTIKYQYD